MKCLTVCQPWAWAIIHGPKRIENRTWPTAYRGPLLIHAGKSVKLLETAFEAGYDWTARCLSEMRFGCILGEVNLVDCVRVENLTKGWVDHPFAEGPWCWLLANPRPLKETVPWHGRLGLFSVPDEIVSDL